MARRSERLEDFRYEAEEYLELNDDRVFVLFRFHSHGKSSGLEIEQMHAKGAHLFHVSCGKVARTVLYLGERALADLGLASESDTADSPD